MLTATKAKDLPLPEFDLQQEARQLAETNHYFEDSIVRTYWFPDAEKHEVRLVHIDTDTFEKPGVIRPFYFSYSITEAEFVPASAVALIPPEQERRSQLPEGWGEWSDAVVWEWSKAVE